MKNIISLCLLFPLLAFAENPKKPHPCHADRTKLCPEFATPEAAKSCMFSHLNDLSPECQKLYKEAVAKDSASASGKEAASLQACEKDLEKFCKNENGNSAAKLKCLSKKAKSLSAGCKAAVAP